MIIFCNRCNKQVEPVVSITKYKAFDRFRGVNEDKEHVRAECSLCGRWIKWLSKLDYEKIISSSTEFCK